MSETTKFGDSKVILQKDPTFDHAHFDFEELRRTGLEHIGKLAGKIWTDHNVHDPGVTLLELICYALLDLGYRTKLPIEQILAKPEDEEEDNFFTPAQILTCNPVTILDYRKLLMDVPSVRNAWLEIDRDHTLYACCPSPPQSDSDDDVIFHTHGHPAHSSLSCIQHSECDHEITLNGLYKVSIEIDWENRFCLNSQDTAAKGKEEAIVKQVKSTLFKHRNLAEDFTSISVLCEQKIGICTEIEIAETADPVELFFQIIEAVDLFLSPQVNYYTLSEYLKDHSIESAYSGRPYTMDSYGFIDTEQLSHIPRRKEIHLSDLYGVLMQLGEGIIRVSDLVLSAYDQNGQELYNSLNHQNFCDNQGYCADWILPLLKDHIPKLCFAHSTIIFTKSGIPQQVDRDKVEMRLLQLSLSSRRSRYTNPIDLDIPIQYGQLRENLGQHYSIQNDLPRVYGIREGGLPDSASTARKSQALQLQGYLVFFDALLSSYLSQLGHIRHLFSYRPDRDRAMEDQHTYFVQPLEDLPQAEKIIRFFKKDQSDGPELVWQTGKVVAILIEANRNTSLELDYLQDRSDIDLNYTEYYFDSTGERNAVLKQLQREFIQDQIESQICQAKCGFFFVMKSRIPDFLIYSKTTYSTKNEALAAAESLSFIGTQIKAYRTSNFPDSHPPKFTFEIVEPAGYYLDYLQQMLEDRSQYVRRRNQFLDHLLARFSEKFADYALLHFALQTDQRQLAENKANYLSHYPQISRDRGKGFNICKPVWNTENMSGFERRIAAISGTNLVKTDLCNFEIHEYQDEFRIMIPDQQGNSLLRSDVTFDSRDEAVLALDRLLLGSERDKGYSLFYDESKDSYGFRIQMDHVSFSSCIRYDTAQSRDQDLTIWKSRFQQEISEKDIYVSKYQYHLELIDQKKQVLARYPTKFISEEKANTAQSDFHKQITSRFKSRTKRPQLLPSGVVKGKYYQFEKIQEYCIIKDPTFIWTWKDRFNRFEITSEVRYDRPAHTISDFLSLGERQWELQDASGTHDSYLLGKQDIKLAQVQWMQGSKEDILGAEAIREEIASFQKRFIVEKSKGYRWHIRDNRQILLSSKFMYEDRRKAKRAADEARDQGSNQMNLEIQKCEKGYYIRLIDGTGQICAESPVYENEKHALKWMENLHQSIRLKKNVHVDVSQKAFAYCWPDGESEGKVLFSYRLFKSPADAILGLLTDLGNSGQLEIFTTGDEANLDYSFLIRTKQGQFVASHPNTYASKGENELIARQVLSQFERSNMPLSFQEQYQYSVENQNGQTLLQPTSYLTAIRSAEKAFLEALKTYAKEESLQVVENHGSFRVELVKKNQCIGTTPKNFETTEQAKKYVSEIKSFLDRFTCSIRIRQQEHRYKYNIWLTNVDDGEHPLFESVLDFSSKHLAIRHAKKYLSDRSGLEIIHKKNGKQPRLEIRDKKSRESIYLSRQNPKISREQIHVASDEYRYWTGMITSKNLEAFVKESEQSKAGKFVYRVLDKNEPVAYDPCACYEKMDHSYTTRLREILKASKDGYQFAQICMGSEAIIKIDLLFHFVLKDSCTGDIYFVSWQGYASQEQAREAFTAQYLEVLEQASKQENYPGVIRLARPEKTKNTICISGDEPIAWIPAETRTKFGLARIIHWACSYPIRLKKLHKDQAVSNGCQSNYTFSYYFHLISNELNEECKVHWTSWRSWNTIAEAWESFKNFLPLLQYKGNGRPYLDQENCCHQIALWNILLESNQRFQSEDEAWSGLDLLLEAACREDAFCRQVTQNPEYCSSFYITTSQYDIAKHPRQYDHPEGRDVAIREVYQQCSNPLVIDFLVESKQVGASYIFILTIQGETIWEGQSDHGTAAEAEQIGQDKLLEMMAYAREERFYAETDQGIQLHDYHLDGHSSAVNPILVHHGPFSIKKLVQIAKHFPFVQEKEGIGFQVYCESMTNDLKIDDRPCNPCHEEEQDYPVRGVIIWMNTRLYETLADARADLDRLISSSKDRTRYRSCSDRDCGPYSFSFVDPDQILAIHPVCYERDKQMQAQLNKTKELMYPVGMHIVEHILLRPDHTEPLDCQCLMQNDPDCHCELPVEDETSQDPCQENANAVQSRYMPGADPYSFRVSVVLPCWSKPLNQKEMRRMYEQILLREAPAHIYLDINWINPKQLCDFERKYKRWLRYHRGASLCPESNAKCDLIHALSGLTDCEFYESGDHPDPGCRANGEAVVTINQAKLYNFYYHSTPERKHVLNPLLQAIPGHSRSLSLPIKEWKQNMELVHSISTDIQLPGVLKKSPEIAIKVDQSDMPGDREMEKDRALRSRKSRYREKIELLGGSIGNRTFELAKFHVDTNPGLQNLQAVVQMILQYGLRKNSKKEEEYKSLLAHVICASLDQFVIDNPDRVIYKNELQEIFAQIEQAGVTTSDLLQSWNYPELAKLLPSGSAEKFYVLLRKMNQK